MLYQIVDGTLHAGSIVVLEHFNFEIKGSDKIAIVGENGSGKTTLLKVIAGELDLERDDQRIGQAIRLARNVTIGMLHQHPFFESKDQTVEEEMMTYAPLVDEWSKERFDYEQEYDRIFTGFGFKKDDKSRMISSFSGGEQTKLAFIRLLLQKPDILLLDEPTNHLDMETVEWLENYIKNYPKAVVMVSHDRFFLDQTVNRIYEIEDKNVHCYVGNYTLYREEKQKKIALQLKKYLQQQEEIEKLEENIRRFKSKPKKAAFARSKKKMLDRMDRIEKPKEGQSHIFTGEIVPERLGNKLVLDLDELQIGYNRAIKNITLRVRRGQKIAVIGPNGIGKSTFLKTIAEIIPPIKGKYRIGEQIDLGYFDQQSAALDSSEQVIEHFRQLFPGLNDKETRQYLANYLFRGAKAHTSINHLSGGEKSRLVLAELLAQKPNFLVLDEPTNHMDIPAKETLESAFLSYKGTMLFVSHDRYFISKVADALLIFTKDDVLYYPFDYKHYLQRIENQRKNPYQSEMIPGVLSAKDQALIDGLKNVPKGATLLGHELSEERLYLDWRLRLATEAMEKARDEFEKIDALLTEKIIEKFPEDPDVELIKVYDEAFTKWNDACIAWFEATIDETEDEMIYE